MGLTLILTRHAKSSWGDPTAEDFVRPLNGRGKASAGALGDWLVEHDLTPDEVIVSGARRTVDTWALIAERLPARAQMRSEPALYEAGAPTILGVLKTATRPTVMLIAHNPGIAEFAERIVAAPPDHPRFSDYPTGATTAIRFDAASWGDVGWAQGAVIDFVVPRNLTED